MLRRLGWRGPFEPTRHVWSRGLALLCDRNGGVGFVREQRGGQAPVPIDPHFYDGVRDGELVWTRATSLPQFLDQVLPRIQARFVLLTGDEDWSIPGDFSRAAELCASDKLLAWYAQNFDGVDPSGKILPLPIGLDFHTISNRRRWGHPLATPREQEIELEELQSGMPPNGQRLLRVHADFHFNKHARPLMGESRDSVERTLRANPLIDFQADEDPAPGIVAGEDPLRFRRQPARQRPRLPPDLGVARAREHRDREALAAGSSVRGSARGHRQSVE